MHVLCIRVLGLQSILRPPQRSKTLFRIWWGPACTYHDRGGHGRSVWPIHVDRPPKLSWWPARVFCGIIRLVVQRHRMGGGNRDEYSRRCVTCASRDSRLPLRCSSNARLKQWPNRTGVPMFHNLGFAMVHHCSSVLDIPGFLWYAKCNLSFIWWSGWLLRLRPFLTLTLPQCSRSSQ